MFLFEKLKGCYLLSISTCEWLQQYDNYLPYIIFLTTSLILQTIEDPEPNAYNNPRSSSKTSDIPIDTSDEDEDNYLGSQVDN